MNKTVKWIVGLIVLLVVVVWGYSVFKNPSSPVSNEPIKIGADFSLTSFGASWGEFNRDAASLAVKEINNGGGINKQRVELLIEDNKSSVIGAIDAAQKLINIDGVHILLTGWADYTNTSAPLLAPNKVVGVTVSAGSPDITKQSSWLFRVWPRDSFLSQALANYIETKGYKKVAIFHTIGAWENGTVSAFKEQLSALGKTVVAEELVNPDSRDVKTQLTKIKNANPDVIYIIALEPVTGLFLSESKKIGLNSPKLFAVDADTSELIKASGGVGNMEGLVYPITKAPRTDFVDKFTAEYGHSPGVSADTTYDAVMLLAQTIKKVGSDPDAIRTELAKTKNFQGVSGVITFDEDRDRNEAPIQLMTIKGGEFIPLQY